MFKDSKGAYEVTGKQTQVVKTNFTSTPFINNYNIPNQMLLSTHIQGHIHVFVCMYTQIYFKYQHLDVITMQVMRGTGIPTCKWPQQN